MKKNYFLTLLLTFITAVSLGQTTLAAGDLVVIELRADSPDTFKFVPLVDLENGTIIKFTENGWDGSALRTNESTITFTADAAIPRGTNIEFAAGTTDSRFSVSGSLGFSSSGDQVIVYQGDVSSPTFIFAVQSNSTQWQTGSTGTTNSDLPSGLTDGVNAVAAGAGAGAGDEFDNIYYNGITTGTPAEILAAVAAASNWVGNNSTSYTPISSNFTINDTSQPGIIINSPSDGTTIAATTSVDVNITVTGFVIGNVGGSGVDGHIHWTIQENSGAVTAQPMKFNTDAETITVSPGNSYTVFMELVDNSHNPISPAVNATTTFTVDFPCDIQLGTISTSCDTATSGTDTYTASIEYTGGGTSTYALATDNGTIGGNDPSTEATGTITISGVSEGTDIAFTLMGDASNSSCDLSRNITSPVCKAFPVYEPFDYSAGTDLISSPDWQNNSTSSDEIQVITGTITNPYAAGEYPDPVGNMINFSGVGSDSYLEFTQTTSGNVFVSFLFTPTDMSTVTNNNGAYWAGFAEAGGSFRSRLWVRPDATDGTKFNVGVSFTSSTSDIVYDTNAYTAGEIMFLVMGYDLDNDIVSVWINPNASTFETASAPTATFTKASADATNLGRFFIRQDSNTETADTNFDELRIGIDWAQVTPKNATASIENSSIQGFQAFPNPVKNKQLTISSSNSDAKEVVLYNVLGRKVLSQDFTGNQKLIDLSNVNSGIYILKVTENGKTSTKKLVVE